MGKLVYLLILFLLFSVPTTLNADVIEADQENNRQQAYYCQDEQIGVQFLCDPDWMIEENVNGAKLVVVSSDPELTLTFLKEDSEVIVLQDLSASLLKEMGQYKDGFIIDEVSIANREAINVEAISSVDDDMRVSDYYVTRDGTLYSFLFAVKPKEEFLKFVPIIFNIVNSVTFLDEVTP